MASRGRGRGRGAKTSLSREQLKALGITGNEPRLQIVEPPSLFPPLQRSCASLESSPYFDNALVLKQELFSYSQWTYLEKPKKLLAEAQEKIEIPSLEFNDYELNLFPRELRPKIKENRKFNVKKQENFIAKLQKFENMEAKSDYNLDKVKTEPKEAEDEKNNAMEEDLVDEMEEEDMDDGTDYANTYFDNGENYFHDDDDNIDDSPIY